jgi:C1A family cysteine protease
MISAEEITNSTSNTPITTNATKENTITANITTNPVDEDLSVFAEFEKFLKQFNRTYTNMEVFNTKYGVFKSNFLKKKILVEGERKNYGDKFKESSFGNSPFMDLTAEEFQNQYLNLKNPIVFPDNSTKVTYYFNENNIPLHKKAADGGKRFLQDAIPDSFDWRDQGAVNSIQSQGSCGGCWAFSAVANLESLYFRKFGTLPKFSEQQLIDCDGSNYGCSGGMMHVAFDYVQSNGIEQLDAYPYLEQQSVCQYDQSNSNSFISGYNFAGSTDEESIKQMLYESGVLSVTINASNLQYYTGGIINVSLDECPDEPNHGVNLVGYGNEDGVDYWIARNTWGTYWGEDGYFRIARGFGLCGISSYVASAY